MDECCQSSHIPRISHGRSQNDWSLHSEAHSNDFWTGNFPQQQTEVGSHTPRGLPTPILIPALSTPLSSEPLPSTATSYGSSSSEDYTLPELQSVSNSFQSPITLPVLPAIPQREKVQLDLIPYKSMAGPTGRSFFYRSLVPITRNRTVHACEHCRDRKSKCSGTRPACRRCEARGLTCVYAQLGVNAGRRGSVAGSSRGRDREISSPKHRLRCVTSMPHLHPQNAFDPMAAWPMGVPASNGLESYHSAEGGWMSGGGYPSPTSTLSSPIDSNGLPLAVDSPVVDASPTDSLHAESWQQNLPPYTFPMVYHQDAFDPALRTELQSLEEGMALFENFHVGNYYQ